MLSSPGEGRRPCHGRRRRLRRLRRLGEKQRMGRKQERGQTLVKVLLYLAETAARNYPQNAEKFVENLLSLCFCIVHQ